jgi:phosphinothricin acetyltransferase
LLSLLKAQGFVSVLGGITLPNPASERLHERFGFKPVGRYKNVGYKCDAWHDVGFYELELNTPSPAPRKPLGLDAVAGMLVTPCA